MIGRRKSPDGMPFRLYISKGKFKTSYGYKLPNGKWAFRLSAPTNQLEEVAKIRAEAIDKAEILNGTKAAPNTTADLISRYFSWQEALPRDSEMRKAAITLKENKVEAEWLKTVFGAMPPEAIKPKHVYMYLTKRAEKGAPAKANKEIALLSAVLEYGRRIGELEANPCRGIKYNKTKPRQKRVALQDKDFAMQIARKHGGSYVVLALCVEAAYLTVSRPGEMRELKRSAIMPDGVEVAVGKRKAGEAKKMKLIEWSPALRAVITEALQLQKTTSMYIFGNTSGQVYSRSGWNTIWKRLMVHCEREAKEAGIEFERFALWDMRPTAVTERKDAGDTAITNATGHSDERMVNLVYDRRKVKRAKATN